ncbi:hypothetical protein [Natronoglomus mannanivorans]|uniref:CARDB protein n=1 Tax=Natronoglomus mannanivorans TaxID=2979990 RepID=A0AAP3E2T8_9EURY|nr:hypothetical protein [Halobacteria archaeon AArc-xg1-1]
MRRRQYLATAGAGIGGLVGVTTSVSATQLEVSIQETNAPVLAGDVFVAWVSVFNRGSYGSQELRLLTGDDVLDTETIEVPGGESYPVPVELAYETYPVEQNVRFPITVECDDDSATEEVSVVTEPDGELTVDLFDVNDPVAAGEVMRARVHVENTGTVAQTQDVQLVTGDEVVDAETQTVADNHTYQFSLSYETHPVQQDVRFPLTVRTGDDSDTQEVEVYADAESAFSVSIDRTNDPVEGTEVLEVWARVRNEGDAADSETVELVSGGDVMDSSSVQLDAGQYTDVRLTFRTYDTQQDVEFPVTVRTGDDSDAEQVVVYAR